ncbi:MAG: alanine racemase [Deltaproteobacteria bacterium]|nr:alanine racemase [Deltaproteobacteria bacterium]
MKPMAPIPVRGAAASTSARQENPPSIWVEIDLEAIRHNVRVLKELIGPGRLFMACVKGDGYGHGLVQAARAALEGGADRLSVAQVEEGINLRRAGIEAPVQVLIEPLAEQAAALFDYGLIPSLSSPEVAQELAARLPGRIKVHVEVDTGMGRVTLRPAEAPAFLDLLQDLGLFEIEGLMTHFSSAHKPQDPAHRAFTLAQLNSFEEAVRACQAQGRRIPLKHTAASGAVVYYPETYLDMVRPGTLIYGLRFGDFDLPLKPALSWKTRVWAVRQVAKGLGLGYEQAYAPQQDTTIAVLAAGYADGYPRTLSNLSHVLIRGQRAPVVGLIGMDQMMAEVDHIPGLGRGEEAVLIGQQGEAEVTASELASQLKTTPVILTVGIAGRVERVYLNQ